MKKTISVSIILAILIIIMSNISYALSCNGQAIQIVPAVVGDNKTFGDGGLINVTLKITQGKGDVFIKGVPHVGTSTKISLRDAVRYAFSLSNFSSDKCDVTVTMGKNRMIDQVEGPSAGIAFTTLTYSALNNLPIRKDATVTGGVNPTGSIIPVGGIYEKAKAAAESNLNYFVTHPSTLRERILLIPIERKYGLKVFEIENASEAIDFFIYNKSLNSTKPRIKNSELPNVTKYNKTDIPEFKKLAIAVINLENKSIREIPDFEDISYLKEHFQKELEKQQFLLEKGYYFTAANDGFNNYIDANAVLAAINEKKLDIDKKKEEIKACIDSLDNIAKNRKNYQFLIGADIRKAWAIQNLADTKEEGMLKEEKYFQYSQLMFADAWCRISSSIEALVKDNNYSGTSINESIWIDIAEKRILALDAINITNREWLRHSKATKLLNDSGKYGASANAATFALTMDEVDNELEGGIITRSGFLETLRNLSDANLTSFWGNVYQAHGIYLLNTNAKPDAYRILRYAKALDELNAELSGALPVEKIKEQEYPALIEEKNLSENKTGILNTSEATTNIPQQKETAKYIVLTFLIVILILAASLIYFILRKKNNDEKVGLPGAKRKVYKKRDYRKKV